MSLDWNIGKVPNKEKVCWIGDDPKTKTLNPVTEALIWRSLSLDLGEIKETNLDEWLFRTRYYSRLFGNPLSKTVGRCRNCRFTEEEIKKGAGGSCEHTDYEEHGESFDFAPEDLKSHIGLYTNVRTHSRAGFLKKMQKQLVFEIERQVKNETQKGQQQ